MRVHVVKPSRSDIEARSPYTKYRDDLRNDFNGSCGYCGDDDTRLDTICFHIDHFAPKKRFPHLEETYSNLVYACRFCNIRKSDHWIGDDPGIHHDGERGFIDPCTDDYDENIGRDKAGRIYGKTAIGLYIVKRLNLNLMRHQFFWQAKRARDLRSEVAALITKVKASDIPDKDIYTSLLENYYLLTEKIEQYEYSAING